MDLARFLAEYERSFAVFQLHQNWRITDIEIGPGVLRAICVPAAAADVVGIAALGHLRHPQNLAGFHISNENIRIAGRRGGSGVIVSRSRVDRVPLRIDGGRIPYARPRRPPEIVAFFRLSDWMPGFENGAGRPQNFPRYRIQSNHRPGVLAAFVSGIRGGNIFERRNRDEHPVVVVFEASGDARNRHAITLGFPFQLSGRGIQSVDVGSAVADEGEPSIGAIGFGDADRGTHRRFGLELPDRAA